MKTRNRKSQTTNQLRHRTLAVAMGLAASAAFLAGSASAQTTIPANTTQNVSDPNTYFGAAGDITIENGATLKTVPSSQGNYTISNALILAGTGGTIHLDFNDNDTIFNFTGPITSTATGPQTLAIATGVNGNGDREEVTFQSGIPDVGDASALGLIVTFGAQTQSYDFVNLVGVNTFSGPITLVQGGNQPLGYLTIGGRGIGSNGNQYQSTPGSGNLGGGTYAGNVTLGTGTFLAYSSTSNQVLSGVISGLGGLHKEGSGTLTLGGLNTYTGDTTVKSGTLELANGGGMTFKLANASNNKVTGAGTANFDGAFNIDTSAVTAPLASWTLVDVTNISFGSNFVVTGFTNNSGVWTNVVGAATWTFTQATGVLSVNTQATITSLSYLGSDGVIDNVAKTILLTVPNGTDLATVAPTFTLTSGSCNQNSGSPPSPTFAVQNPVTYTVTDGAAVTNYAVTVYVAPPLPGGVGDLVLWLDAGTSSSMTLDGSTVNEWRSLTGGAAKATRRGGSPALVASGIGGIPTVHFSNSSWMNDGVNHSAPVTILYISKQTGGSHERVLGATNNNWLLGYHGNQRNRFYFEGWVYGESNGSSPDNRPHLYAATIGGGGQNSTVYADGVELASNQNGTQGPNNLQLNGYNSANELSDVDISEVLVYNRVLTTEELALVSDYLMGKYGLKASITSFGIPGYPGVINQSTKTISLGVPYGTDLATLAPTYTLSSGTCDQPNDGTTPPTPTFAAANPVTYTVTDGATVNAYAVTATTLPQTTTVVIDLGAAGTGTFYEANLFKSLIAKGALPAGSILRSVAIDATLESTNNDNWAAELMVFIDPTPDSPGTDGLLELGPDYLDYGSAQRSFWANGYNGPVTTVTDTKSYPGDWSSPVDLHAAELFLVNGYGGGGNGGWWSGTLSVTYDVVPATGGYSDWATLHAGGGTPGEDYNNDGVQNGVAYFMNATGQAALPGPDSSNKVTWTNGGNIPSSAYGTKFVVQTSSDLASWTDVAAGNPNLSNTDGSVSYTLPSGQGKVFCRLVVTP